MDKPDKPCQGKLTFDSKIQAQGVATTEKFRRGIDLKPYICRHCSLWHLATA